MSMVDHLKQHATTVSWCWKVTRRDGTVFGFTEHDRVITFDECDYEPESGFTASSLQEGNDLSVDSQDLQGAITSDRITEADLLSGLWDAADMQVYLVNWKNPSQRLLVRRGTIGQVSRGKNSFVAEVRSFASRLTDVKGRFYQYFCDARLGDSKCGVSLSAFTNTGNVLEVLPYNRVIVAGDVVAFPEDWFAYGVMTMTSGDLEGTSYSVMSSKERFGGVEITFFSESAPQLKVGNTFTITAGCDKAFQTCGVKFNNTDNYRGFPHIPGNSILQRYPKERGAGYDGGALKK